MPPFFVAGQNRPDAQLLADARVLSTCGYMSTFRNGNLEKISLVSTFEKPYSAKMWPMSTFENEISKIIFFASTLLDWYTHNTTETENSQGHRAEFRESYHLCGEQHPICWTVWYTTNEWGVVLCQEGKKAKDTQGSSNKKL